jgi:hypothetical protein
VLETRYYFFLDYGGIKAPRTVDLYRDNVQTARVVYDSVAFNAPVDAKVFDKPASAKDSAGRSPSAMRRSVGAHRPPSPPGLLILHGVLHHGDRTAKSCCRPSLTDVGVVRKNNEDAFHR